MGSQRAQARNPRVLRAEYTILVREYLTELAKNESAAGRKRREREALQRSFEKFNFKIGKRTWKRSELYDRS
jgi:hypothetical protein